MIINHKTYHNDILLFVKSINIVSKAQILCQSLRLHHQMVRYCVVVPHKMHFLELDKYIMKFGVLQNTLSPNDIIHCDCTTTPHSSMLSDSRHNSAILGRNACLWREERGKFQFSEKCEPLPMFEVFENYQRCENLPVFEV